MDIHWSAVLSLNRKAILSTLHTIILIINKLISRKAIIIVTAQYLQPNAHFGE